MQGGGPVLSGKYWKVTSVHLIQCIEPADYVSGRSSILRSIQKKQVLIQEMKYSAIVGI